MEISTYLLFFLIPLSASVIGSICGIGGGVFIKPALDALNIYPSNTITFLSMCTVFFMSSYNVWSSRKNKNIINWALTTYLAIGSAIGGVLGKVLYSNLIEFLDNSENVGGYQSIILFIVVFLTLVYTKNKSKINSLYITNKVLLMNLGLILGMTSSFLGIGGGPMNIAILCYFLSMNTKEATQNSLYIILVSQTSSLLLTLYNKNIPIEFFIKGNHSIWIILVEVIICGIFGAILGKKINQKLSTNKVEELFVWLIYIILGLCIYNTIIKFGLFR